MVEVAQTSSNYSFDDSQLGHVKELVTELQARLAVEEKMLHAEGSLNAEIPVDQPSNENIVDQVTEYFDGPTTKVVQVAEVAK